MAKGNIASTPVARRWSNIRYTIGRGNLFPYVSRFGLKLNGCGIPITEHGEEPLTTIHARLDALPKKMNIKHWKEFFHKAIELI
jgi:hypothetical protein